MGGRNSGMPPSREKLEFALTLIEQGVSIREAARRVGICRDTIARYRDGAQFRNKQRRCPECGVVVTMPCLRCSTELRVAEAKRQKRIRSRAKRSA